METLSVLFLAVFVLFLLYRWIKINDNYFVDRRLEALKPNLFIGNTLGFLIKKYLCCGRVCFGDLQSISKRKVN